MRKVYTINNGKIISLYRKPKEDEYKWALDFDTYDEALCYLLLMRLENLLDNCKVREGFLVKDRYSKTINKIEKLTLEIRELEKENIIEQEKLCDFNVHGLRVR